MKINSTSTSAYEKKVRELNQNSPSQQSGSSAEQNSQGDRAEIGEQPGGEQEQEGGAMIAGLGGNFGARRSQQVNRPVDTDNQNVQLWRGEGNNSIRVNSAPQLSDEEVRQAGTRAGGSF